MTDPTEFRACGYGRDEDGNPTREATPWGPAGSASAAYDRMILETFERGVAVQIRHPGFLPRVILWHDAVSA